MDSQVAVKAVIRNRDKKYLIVREGERWQAVGGRLEKGEKLEDGLRRETQEETGITDLQVGKVIHVDEWFAKPEGELKHIVALFFLCDVTFDKVTLSNEHQEYAWVTVEDLESYDGNIEKEIKEAIILADMQK
ncbi:NUDIX domain-containing protein [Candidatus Saccharibacteria bacterium]|nr:NUDIX domain-containing protein [Candidatus Saccharibacteria bacterium]